MLVTKKGETIEGETNEGETDLITESLSVILKDPKDLNEEAREAVDEEEGKNITQN
jgi:hypothetical protein